MKRQSIAVLVAFVATLCHSLALAQGISRSSGIGLRTSFWNMAGHTGRFSVSSAPGNGGQVSLDIGGFGAWLYFFSRVHNNWFLEFNLGAVARVRVEDDGFTDTGADVSAVIPFLLGWRHDLLSTRFSSAFQPYLTVGAGPYWTTAVTVKNQLTGEETVVGETKSKFGAYAGGGTNIVLSSWLALNFDVKYHFVDLQANRNESGFEFGLGFSFMWGSKREIFRIKETKVIVRDIYPAYYQFYNTYPLALVAVKNFAGYPIEVNVRSYMRGYSERPKDSGFVRIERGETRDIPVTVFFGPRLRQMAQREPAMLDLRVEARAGGMHTKETSAQIMIHTRNAWNSEMDKLGFFVTPEEEGILRLSRKIVGEMPDHERASAGNLHVAKVIFDELSQKGIRYHRDPNIPFYKDDRVQYAGETLNLRSGDCDDLVVLYSSLLESVGINTAFVEVRDPEKEIAHLYLLFDSGLPAPQGYSISSNEKRYLLREQPSGQSTIWIPVETTLVERGFEEAWKAGALQYQQDGLLRGGLAEGWVQIFDVE
jgi:outer membrane protein W